MHFPDHSPVLIPGGGTKILQALQQGPLPHPLKKVNCLIVFCNPIHTHTEVHISAHTSECIVNIYIGEKHLQNVLHTTEKGFLSRGK